MSYNLAVRRRWEDRTGRAVQCTDPVSTIRKGSWTDVWTEGRCSSFTNAELVRRARSILDQTERDPLGRIACGRCCSLLPLSLPVRRDGHRQPRAQGESDFPRADAELGVEQSEHVRRSLADRCQTLWQNGEGGEAAQGRRCEETFICMPSYVGLTRQLRRTDFVAGCWDLHSGP